MVENLTQGDYILKTILEWAIKCKISFPPEIYKHMENEDLELYTKCLVVQELWNKALRIENK